MYQLCPNIPTRSTSKLKRDHVTYQCKGVFWGGGAGRQGMVWGCDIFPKFVVKFFCPHANHSSQMHQNFLELINFIRVATVREKSGKNKNFSRSGKSQGIFYKVRELCFLAQCIKVGSGPLKAKLILSERFQPDGVF